MTYCQHCPIMESQGHEHQLVCNCGHHHSDHVFAGDCTKCSCDRYNQSLKLKPGQVKTKLIVGSKNA